MLPNICVILITFLSILLFLKSIKTQNLKDQITNNEIVESDKEKQIHKLSNKSLILGTPSQFSSLELKEFFFYLLIFS